MMLIKFVSGVDRLSEWVGKTVSWLCLLMICVLTYEIVLHQFNKSTQWAHETTTMLYGTFCMLGAVWTLRNKGHIGTEVVHQLFPQKIREFLDVCSGIIVLLTLCVFFYATFEFAADSWRENETSNKSTWGVIIYPFKTVPPATAVLLILQQLAHTMRDVACLFGLSLNDDSYSIQD